MALSTARAHEKSLEAMKEKDADKERIVENMKDLELSVEKWRQEALRLKGGPAEYESEGLPACGSRPFYDYVSIEASGSRFAPLIDMTAEMLREHAEDGDPEAQALLSMRYYEGNGVTQSNVRSA